MHHDGELKVVRARLFTFMFYIGEFSIARTR